MEGADAVWRLTRHSDGSAEQRCELQTAKANDKPVLGVNVYADDPVPSELERSPVSEWTWKAIVDWSDSLLEE